MSRKLDNTAWEEYINEFDFLKGSKTVKDFCIENEFGFLLVKHFRM
jgi:hypothetical protein